MRRIVPLALGFWVSGAVASPPNGLDPQSRVADWFRSLKQPQTGLGCCSVADCRTATFRINEAGQYEVWIEDKWRLVPPNSVVRRESNPTGLPVVCYHRVPDWDGAHGTGYDRLEIRCFVPYRPVS